MIEVFRLVDYSRLAHILTVVVDEYVAHDGEYPSLEIHIVNIFVFIGKSLESGVLEQILSLFPVCCKLVCKVEKISLNSNQTFFCPVLKNLDWDLYC